MECGATSSGEKKPAPASLEATIATFKANPRGIPNLHEVAVAKYTAFCERRTSALYTTFLDAIGDGAYHDWLSDEGAVFCESFKACAPMPGKTHERLVCGGMSRGGGEEKKKCTGSSGTNTTSALWRSAGKMGSNMACGWFACRLGTFTFDSTRTANGSRRLC